VVCPWPPEIPAPSRRGEQRLRHPERARNAEQQLVTERMHGAFQQIRRSFARLGVPVVCAQSGDPARLILDRLDRLRMLGRKR
jgi:hypothetical protein